MNSNQVVFHVRPQHGGHITMMAQHCIFLNMKSKKCNPKILDPTRERSFLSHGYQKSLFQWIFVHESMAISRIFIFYHTYQLPNGFRRFKTRELGNWLNRNHYVKWHVITFLIRDYIIPKGSWVAPWGSYGTHGTHGTHGSPAVHGHVMPCLSLSNIATPFFHRVSLSLCFCFPMVFQCLDRIALQQSDYKNPPDDGTTWNLQILLADFPHPRLMTLESS